MKSQAASAASASAAAAGVATTSAATTVNSPVPSTFWTNSHYPSESEFDTTRFTRSALLFSCNNNQQQQQQQQQHNGVKRTNNNRSKSVDRSSIKMLKRQVVMLPSAAVFPAAHRYHQHVNHPHAAFIDPAFLLHQQQQLLRYHMEHEHSNNNNNNNKASLSKILSSLKNITLSHGNKSQLIVSRSLSKLVVESLNPDNSSDPLTSENENNGINTAISRLKQPSNSIDPPKSVLKKSSSSPSSKNVTFSSFATIQMVDNKRISSE